MRQLSMFCLLLVCFSFNSCVEKTKDIDKKYDSKIIVSELKHKSLLYYEGEVRKSDFSKQNNLDKKKLDINNPYIYLNRFEDRVLSVSVIDPEKSKVRYLVSFVFIGKSYNIRHCYFMRLTPDGAYYEENKQVDVYEHFNGLCEVYLSETNENLSKYVILDGKRVVNVSSSNSHARSADDGIDLPEVVVIGRAGISCPICSTEGIDIFARSCPVCGYCFGNGGLSCGGGGGGGTINPSNGGSGIIPVVQLNVSGEKIEPKQETKCFNKQQGAKLTIFVEQPNPGTRDVRGPNQVGHAFIGIEQNGINRYMGYYPDSPAASLISSQNGELHSNANSNYNVSVSVNVNSQQLNDMLSYVNNFPKTYNLNSNNCTDFALNVARQGGLNLPGTIGTYNFGIGTFRGHNPGDLGEDIKAMSLPKDATRNASGGNAPSKSGNCP